MFPPRMLFAGGLSDATQWGIISCQCSSTKRGANLHLKWHIVVGLGTNRGQKKRGGFFEYRKTRAVFYLFVLIVPSVLSNQLYYSHWWTPRGCWNVLLFWAVFFFFFPSKLCLKACVIASVWLWQANVATAWNFLCSFSSERNSNYFGHLPSVTTGSEMFLIEPRPKCITLPHHNVVNIGFLDWHKEVSAATDLVYNI